MLKLRILNWEEIEFHKCFLYFLKWFEHESRFDDVHISILQLKVEFLLYFFDSIGDSLVKLHLIDVYLNVSLVQHLNCFFNAR